MSGSEHTRSSLFTDAELDQVAADAAEIRARKAAFDVAYAAELAKLAAHTSQDALASHGRSLLPLALQAAHAAGVPAPVLAALAVLEALVSSP